ncbi:MAG TPA: hypothetical protein VJN96_27010 [Vicinamibacterales bacterium]|nr:hypothetical protein [Vicinamibacterales bacterium]
MSRHLGLIAVCACIAASIGCDGAPGVTPTPTPTVTPTPKVTPTPTASTVTVEFGGRVVTADVGGPVGNVLVSAEAISIPKTTVGWVNPTNTTTSGGDGTFTLPLNLPTGWRSLYLKLTAPPGYDDAYHEFLPNTAADRPAIRMYPTLVIKPGESLEVRVEDLETCGWGGEAGNCRRVLVAASPGELVELELVPDDSSKPMGLSPDNFVGAYTPVSRIMVSPGDYPYVIGAGTAKLMARR